MFPILAFETRSYISNKMAIFWTVAYPIAMLSLLISIFDPGLATDDVFASYRFKTTVGLITLTIVSTALFGMGQAMSEMRAQRALIPYLFLPVSASTIIFAILFSRIIIIVGFSAGFFYGAFFILGVDINYTAIIVLQVFLSLLAASLFSFALVLPLLYISRNAATIIALANLVNIYALMSAGVFIPMEALPSWSKIFVISSPFYYLNIGLQASFEQDFGAFVLLTGAAISALGIGIVMILASNKLLVPK